MSDRNKEKALQLLGLAMRAGKLVTGEERTVADIRKNKAKYVFVALDASNNTKKKIRDKSTYYKVPCYENFSENEIAQAIGRPRKVLGILDQGFAKKLAELIQG